MTSASPPQVLTVREIADILRVGRRQAYQAIHRGEIPGCHKIGGSVRCSNVAIQRWLDGEVMIEKGGESDARSANARVQLLEGTTVVRGMAG